MNHSTHKGEAASTVAATVSSIALSVIASSHHWLHMAILLLVGGSTNALAGMTGIVWVRRAMIVASLVTTAFALYRLATRKHMPIWMKGLTYLSAAVTIGFIVYTVVLNGW